MTTILVGDGMNLLHRGFFATPGMTNAAGVPTNALRGLITILLADIRRVEATHCAIVFDRPGLNFRHELYPEYKANRDNKDGPNMRQVVLPAKRLLNAMGIRVFGKRNVEGDDIIGSLAVKLSEYGKVFIDSNDKDFACLVNKRIHLLKPKGLTLDAQGVFDTYGVWPKQMVDYLMMLGDSVDNVPGVHKVGKITAAKLLAEHGTLKAICKEAKFTPKMRENFKAARKHFPLTRKLITLDLSHAEKVKLKDVAFAGFSSDLKAICDELGFRSTYSAIVNNLGRR